MKEEEWKTPRGSRILSRKSVHRDPKKPPAVERKSLIWRDFLDRNRNLRRPGAIGIECLLTTWNRRVPKQACADDPNSAAVVGIAEMERETSE